MLLIFLLSFLYYNKEFFNKERGFKGLKVLKLSYFIFNKPYKFN
jgi:hypothetical protein